MSDDLKPANGAVPPKLTLRKGETAAIPPQTIPDAPAVVAVPKAATSRVDLSTTQTPASVQTLKKSTTRIPLESSGGGTADTPTIGEQNISSKTIRLTPLSAARPMTIPPAPRPVPSAAEAAKRQTSRIPLEAALAEERAAATGTATAAGGPKTIRIKRPTQTPATLPTSLPSAAPDASTAQTIQQTQKSKTSRVDSADIQAEATAQATQRKTIKIRRAEGAVSRPAPRSFAVARLEAEAAERQVEDRVQVHVAFPIMAAVALVVLGLLVVVLAAQAFPNLGWKLPLV